MDIYFNCSKTARKINNEIYIFLQIAKIVGNLNMHQSMSVGEYKIKWLSKTFNQ